MDESNSIPANKASDVVNTEEGEDLQINKQDLIHGDENDDEEEVHLSLLDIEQEHDQVEIEQEEDEMQKSSNYVPKICYKAKLTELLRNLFSQEFKIHSFAAKEFIKLLRSESGGELLNQFVEVSPPSKGTPASKDSLAVKGSPPCKELLEAWKIRKGKPGVAHVLLLIAEILSHPEGKYKANDFGRIVLTRKLDKLADAVVDKERLEDVYTELNSKEARRQSAALSLMAAVVRRGDGCALRVYKEFDFKLPVFPKLAEANMKIVAKKGKFFTRYSFIEFAMSFLENGKARLLRSVLQLKDMYFGVLRGLANDDEETIVYVLSTLRDRVLIPSSLVPPGLRSVLFGSVTLDQLISISGNSNGGLSANIAHEVLLMVCTDPCNGLMPDPKAHMNPLKGNPRRLLELMNKLRAIENGYHKELLLAIVRGRPSFGSAYMDEFPYLLEPRASPTWFSAISLASDLISSTRENFIISSLSSQHHDPPSLDSSEMQCLLKCIIPRAFSRIVINRGLLHFDVSVRHGSMRLLLEALKSLDTLVGAIDRKSRSADLVVQKWMSLLQKVQDEARALLPDSQVLYKLLSLQSHGGMKSWDMSLKRPRRSEESSETDWNHGVKKLKSDIANADIDIIINGVPIEASNDISKERGNASASLVIELEKEEDRVNVISGIWSSHNSNISGNDPKDADTYFHSKLLDALTLYLRTMPMVLDGSFDFFKVLPSDPFTLSISQQQSLLALLIEYIGWSPQSRISYFRPPDNMYKHLRPLLDLLIYSPVKDIQDQAYLLARAAMLSTGLFDRNCLEIDAWLFFLPGYGRDKSSIGSQAEVFQDWSKVVVSFLCDAISTTGNNFYKYMDHLRCLISSLKDFTEISLDFSPLFICTLKKCLRLLDSDSGAFKLYQKSMISMYVCNTLSFILQTQVDGRLLSSGIDLILIERLGDSSACGDTSFCEWRPLKNLLLFSQSISHQNDSYCELKPSKKSLLLAHNGPYQRASTSLCSITNKASNSTYHSFAKTLCETKKIIRSLSGVSLVGVARAFCSSILCASPDEILENFPSVVTVSAHLLGAHFQFLSSVFFHEGNLLVRVANQWPDIFSSSLELVTVEGSTADKMKDALVRDTNSNSSSEESICSMDFDSMDSTSVAFSSFLEQGSFHVLFPAIMGVGCSNLLGSTTLIGFLKDKLSSDFIDNSVASLRLLLFWAHQIQFSYRVEPLAELEKLSEICFILIEHLLGRVMVIQSDSSNSKSVEASSTTTRIREVTETIFQHPAVMKALSHPLCCNEDVIYGSLAVRSNDILSSSKSSINPISNNILHLLTTVVDYLLGLDNDQKFVSEPEKTIDKQLAKTFRTLVQQVVLIFKKKYKLAIKHKELLEFLPTYFVLGALIRIIPPFVLLELVDYIFELCDSICLESDKVTALSIGCHIADGAFDLLSSYVHQRNTNTARLSLFWEVDEKTFDVPLIERIYNRVLCCATSFKLDCADLCLLKAVNVVYKQKLMPPQEAMLPSCMAISRVIMSSPISLLVHCIHEISATKAKLLFQLSEVSPMHLTLFGQMFSLTMNKDPHLKVSRILGNFNHGCTDEQYMMLLPIAVSYLEMIRVKFGLQYLNNFDHIPSIYSKILLDGFLNWKSYTCRNIFQEEFGKSSLSSTQELLNLFSCSLLGRAIRMLQHYFYLDSTSMKMKKRMKLFDSVCPCPGVPDDFLDFDVKDIKGCSVQQSLICINRVVAKIYFCRVLLFPKNSLIQPLLTETNVCPEEIWSEAGCNKEEDSPVLKFITILVKTLHKIVKRFPLVAEGSVSLKSTECSQLFRYLEIFILRNLFELSVKGRNDLNQMSSIKFVDRFARSSLLHRFEDPTTLKVLRSVLTVCEGKFSCGVIFELLLTHSKFVPSILWNGSISDSSGLLNTGTLLRPMSSVLKSSFLGADHSEADNAFVLKVSSSYKQKLEVIKLFRVLYHLKASQGSTPGEDSSMNSKELLSLLLSCYGATMSEIDLEIFDLMNEIVTIEVFDRVSIADMDYLWGSSALRLREMALENHHISANTTDYETVEECRRRQFRENLAIDSKKCATTILNFPYDRVVPHIPTSWRNLKQDDCMSMRETSSTCIERIQRYDPAFILPFSIHGLSMGYLEPLEFAGLGLLAIAFVSISSPDGGIRKLGYEVIGRFKNALESCRNRKDELGILRLLLIVLQNGITEPMQRIPSIMAIFAAEASFISLDPSHDHYRTIQKLLTHSQRINLQCIPLFNTMFGSTSVNFEIERLWILQLSHTGLNLDDDARIFIRTRVVENLLSFYSSSLSDYQSKTLILQIVKKSIKFPALARYLVQQCNLISWLSSVLSSCSEVPCDDDQNPFLTQITIALEVVNGVIAVESISKWLREDALEQLSKLSSHALRLYMSSSKLIKQNTTLVILVLKILVSTLRISQERDMDQPHFSISYGGLFQLCKFVDNEPNTIAAASAELVLRAILISAPCVVIPQKGGNLVRIIMWGISTVSKSNTKETVVTKDSKIEFSNNLGKSEGEDSPISKLLRWVTASVLLGKISRKYYKTNSFMSSERSDIHNLQLLLEHTKKVNCELEIDDRDDSGIAYRDSEALAAIILYLQQVLGINCKVLPSVISALCLLLLSNASNSTGLVALDDNQIDFVASLCLKIRCPAEANPAWRWSYDKPWSDTSSELTELQLEEQHACETLLVIFSNALRGKFSSSQFLSHQDLEESGVFTWEKNILVSRVNP